MPLPIDSRFKVKKKQAKTVSTGEPCPECKVGELILRPGKWGPWKGCSRYPECRYTEGSDKNSIEKEADRLLARAGYGNLNKLRMI